MKMHHPQRRQEPKEDLGKWRIARAHQSTREREDQDKERTEDQEKKRKADDQEQSERKRKIVIIGQEDANEPNDEDDVLIGCLNNEGSESTKSERRKKAQEMSDEIKRHMKSGETCDDGTIQE